MVSLRGAPGAARRRASFQRVSRPHRAGEARAHYSEPAELSDWIGLNCSVVDAAHPEVSSAVTATRRAETRMAYVPRGSFTILDTWQVGGLRGTGSHDVVV